MTPRGASSGLGDLRRSGAITELLFLYACTVDEPTQLRPIAEELGVTVQAVSHSFRQLSARGLAEVRDGHYRPTVQGVAWLHQSLGRLGEDVEGRVRRLSVIRSCRAVALSDLRRGDSVSLEMRDGVLSARAGGRGPSKGRANADAPRGALVEIGQLDGILPISPAGITVLTLTESDLADPRLAVRLAHRVGRPSSGLLAAHGLEAFHALRSATRRPVVRFAVGAASREAARIGVPTTVIVLDSALPHLLAEFSGSGGPPLRVQPLGRGAGRGRRRG